MQIVPDDLNQAVAEKILTQQQADALWKMLTLRRPIADSRLQFAAVVYYLGTFLVLMAMIWLATLGNSWWGDVGLFFISLFYAYIFAHLGWHFWQRTTYKTSGGLLCALAVCMVPFIVYGLEKGMGMWPTFAYEAVGQEAYKRDLLLTHRYWLSIELITFLASLVALYFVRFPFLTAPLILSLWFLISDSLPLLFGQEELVSSYYAWALIGFGLCLIVGAYSVDKGTRQDFAFWGYAFGVTALAMGMLGAMMFNTPESVKVIYVLLNLGLLFLAVLLNRCAFLVGGALGIFTYLCYLAYEVFQDLFLFPLILSILGFGIIYMGIIYQKYQHVIREGILNNLPEKWKNLLP